MLGAAVVAAPSPAAMLMVGPVATSPGSAVPGTAAAASPGSPSAVLVIGLVAASPGSPSVIGMVVASPRPPSAVQEAAAAASPRPPSAVLRGAVAASPRPPSAVGPHAPLLLISGRSVAACSPSARSILDSRE